VNFRGQFKTNVGTANNDDITSVFPAQQYVDSALVQVDTHGMNDADFATWLKQVQAPFGIRGGWNVFGDQSVEFVDVTAHSVQLTGTQPQTAAGSDSILGASVQLNQAVMVDLDPEGTLGTQIFCDEFRLQTMSGLSIVGQ